MTLYHLLFHLSCNIRHIWSSSLQKTTSTDIYFIVDKRCRHIGSFDIHYMSYAVIYSAVDDTYGSIFLNIPLLHRTSTYTRSSNICQTANRPYRQRTLLSTLQQIAYIVTLHRSSPYIWLSTMYSTANRSSIRLLLLSALQYMTHTFIFLKIYQHNIVVRHINDHLI